MDLADKAALNSALSRIKSAFGTSPPQSLSDDYFSGRLLDPGIYEKVGIGSLDGKPLWAYLLIAEGFVRQPSLDHYYDIFRAARVIPLLRSVDIATGQLVNVDISRQVARAVNAQNFDALDAVLFEMIVGGSYQRRFSNGTLTFLKETAHLQTPDFSVTFPHSPPVFVECKKLNRSNDFQAKMRRQARELLRPVLWQARSMRARVAVRVVFLRDLSSLSAENLVSAFRRATTDGSVETESFSLEVGPLGPKDEDFLYPSPKYFHQRFGYDPEVWHGLIPGLEGRRSGCSFFESADWDSAILWRSEVPSAAWKANKFNFGLLFKGLDQLRPQEGETTLHVWIERDSAWGHRAKHLREFCQRLESSREAFAHIVFNETHAQVTPGGFFDFREHASALGGPKRSMEDPPLMRVFTGPEDREGEIGEWGVGVELLSLDQLGGKP